MCRLKSITASISVALVGDGHSRTGPKQTARFWDVILFTSAFWETRFRWSSNSNMVSYKYKISREMWKVRGWKGGGEGKRGQGENGGGERGDEEGQGGMMYGPAEATWYSTNTKYHMKCGELEGRKEGGARI